MLFLVGLLASAFNPIAYFSQPLFPEPNSHTGFSPQRKGLRRDGEGYKHFPPTPCFVHRVDANLSNPLATFPED
jgi:hypothetical protein